jgi:hypothetical protein
MRFDKDKFPSLFHKGLIVEHLFDSKLTDLMTDSVSLAQDNTYYISKTTMGAIEKSFPKLLTILEQVPDVFRGLCFLTKQGHPHTMLYGLFNGERDGVKFTNIMMQIHAVDLYGRQMGVLMNGYFSRDAEGTRFYTRDTTLKDDQFNCDLARKALAVELFLNFAEIETKVCQPSRQIWDGPTCLYNNKTKLPITVVDSSWYTNLVVSGAFNVAGHFRLQPYGPERSKRRLQWINDFQKNGYIRKAKKENSHESAENDPGK